jgi:N-carbamoylputrescine amidase
MTFTVACAQFSPQKGKLDANLDTMADLLLQAADEGADLVAYPETATSGYFLEGGVLENALTGPDLLHRFQSRVQRKLERPVDAVVGFYEAHEGNLYNSAAYLELGQEPRLVHVYRKFFLPTYGVFDEERFVSAGRELGVFDTRFGRVGILICEDVWHSVLSTLVAMKGAQVVVVPSASPARGFEGETIGNLDRYERMTRAVAEEHGVFCVNCQLTGFEGGKGFVGGSMVADPRGRIIAKGPVAEDHLLVVPIDLDLIAITRAQMPLISDLRREWTRILELGREL